MIFAGSLESANSSILAARRPFKDFGGGKNQDFMIIRCPIRLICLPVMSFYNIIMGQHVRQRHNIIFDLFCLRVTFSKILVGKKSGFYVN